MAFNYLIVCVIVCVSSQLELLASRWWALLLLCTSYCASSYVSCKRRWQFVQRLVRTNREALLLRRELMLAVAPLARACCCVARSHLLLRRKLMLAVASRAHACCCSVALVPRMGQAIAIAQRNFRSVKSICTWL